MNPKDRNLRLWTRHRSILGIGATRFDGPACSRATASLRLASKTSARLHEPLAPLACFFRASDAAMRGMLGVERGGFKGWFQGVVSRNPLFWGGFKSKPMPIPTFGHGLPFFQQPQKRSLPEAMARPPGPGDSVHFRQTRLGPGHLTSGIQVCRFSGSSLWNCFECPTKGNSNSKWLDKR